MASLFVISAGSGPKICRGHEGEIQEVFCCDMFGQAVCMPLTSLPSITGATCCAFAACFPAYDGPSSSSLIPSAMSYMPGQWHCLKHAVALSLDTPQVDKMNVCTHGMHSAGHCSRGILHEHCHPIRHIC